MMETDLDQLIRHDIPFNQDQMIKVLYNTICSMAFLHHANIMHRDLKSANLLLSSECNIKVCDFGLSRSIPRIYLDLSNMNT